MSGPATYLIRWRGVVTGPLSREEIDARLGAREIGLMHEVQSGSEWITLATFISELGEADAREGGSGAGLEPADENSPAPGAAKGDFERGVGQVGNGWAGGMGTLPERRAGSILAYAGFWTRAIAALIDSALMAAVALATSWSAGYTRADFSWGTWDGQAVGVVAAVLAVASWVYGALLESSELGATAGKWCVGLRVTGLEGGRISFLAATARHFGKFLSGALLGFGFFLAAFSPRKQALHDVMAGTAVLQRIEPIRLLG